MEAPNTDSYFSNFDKKSAWRSSNVASRVVSSISPGSLIMVLQDAIFTIVLTLKKMENLGPEKNILPMLKYQQTIIPREDDEDTSCLRRPG